MADVSDAQLRPMKPGPRNLITDVEGLRVGNADNTALKSGTTVLVGEAPFVASVDIMGGAPGTRETELLTNRMYSDGLGIAPIFDVCRTELRG